MYYRMERYLRTARRKDRTLIFNPIKGSCIALDECSYKIAKYISDTYPTKEQIYNFSKNVNISEQSLNKLLICLKEKGFLYENF